MVALETGCEHLRLSIDGRVAVLTIDNAADQNRLTPAAMTALGALVERLRGRDDVQCVVITAVGEVFSMGLLNPTLREAMSKDDVVGFVLAANRVFDAIEALPQVVLCGINGPLRAGAAELAMACDIRYVADNATLTLPEAGWGGFPGAGAPVRLPHHRRRDDAALRLRRRGLPGRRAAAGGAGAGAGGRRCRPVGDARRQADHARPPGAGPAGRARVVRRLAPGARMEP